jgi:phospholipid/cholesterol/gamma-HCH transport system substrate-binding protein
MKSSNFKLRLGLFVIAGFTLFAIAIFLIGQQKNLFNPIFRITTSFYNISGLQVGNNIRFLGISVGTVENIKIINDSTVKVDMIIQRKIQEFIKTDCQVSIGSEGIIGDRLLVITQSTTDAPSVKDGQYLTSIEPVEMDAIFVSLSTSAANAEVITLQLAEIVTNINQGQGTIGRLIQDSTIAQDISEIIVNLKETSADINRNMDIVMVNLEQTADHLLTSAGQVAEIVTNINQGQGTIGRLIQDTVIAENINQMIFHLKGSSQGLNENMQALQNNFLFRGFFRRQEKEAAKEKEQMRQDSLKLEAARIIDLIMEEDMEEN